MKKFNAILVGIVLMATVGQHWRQKLWQRTKMNVRNITQSGWHARR